MPNPVLINLLWLICAFLSGGRECEARFVRAELPKKFLTKFRDPQQLLGALEALLGAKNLGLRHLSAVSRSISDLEFPPQFDQHVDSERVADIIGNYSPMPTFAQLARGVMTDTLHGRDRQARESLTLFCVAVSDYLSKTGRGGHVEDALGHAPFVDEIAVYAAKPARRKRFSETDSDREGPNIAVAC